MKFQHLVLLQVADLRHPASFTKKEGFLSCVVNEMLTLYAARLIEPEEVNAILSS